MHIMPYCPMPVEAEHKVLGCSIRGPRLSFQWWCVLATRGKILDVGCCDDPNGFGHRVVHFDYDDWSKYYEAMGQTFVQGDVHKLSDCFEPESFELVLLGDILEHCPDPYIACAEAAAVTNRFLCLTVWEEWRGPGGKKQLEWSQAQLEEEAQDKGFSSVGAMYKDEHPLCTMACNRTLAHLGHCQKFTDEYMEELVAHICNTYSMAPVALYKTWEVNHEGHDVYNWLILLEKEQ